MHPPLFIGPPNERAAKAVEYARAGHPLTKALIACGYHAATSPSLREILAGDGPAIQAARRAVETGRLDYAGNRACLTLVRDYYGLPKVNGEPSVQPQVERLRHELRRTPQSWASVAYHAGLCEGSIAAFVRGAFSFKLATVRRVRDALESC